VGRQSLLVNGSQSDKNDGRGIKIALGAPNFYKMSLPYLPWGPWPGFYGLKTNFVVAEVKFRGFVPEEGRESTSC